MESFFPPAPIQDDQTFCPVNYYCGQKELCPNCLSLFETEVRWGSFFSSQVPTILQFASIWFSQRCNVKCLLSLDKVPEENRTELELIMHSRLLEQQMEANVFHMIQAYNTALACEQAKVEPLLPAEVLWDFLAWLNHHRDLLSSNSKYTSSEEERLRGGRIGVIQHLLSPEHQFGLPVWLRRILPMHYNIYPTNSKDKSVW